jgi:hypothetical protein
VYVSALSAGVYTTTLYMLVRYSERGWACTPHPEARADLTLMMECTPESGHCHSVYSVVFHIRKETQSLYCTEFHVCHREIKRRKKSMDLIQATGLKLASEPETRHGSTRVSGQPGLLKHLRVGSVLLILVLIFLPVEMYE